MTPLEVNQALSGLAASSPNPIETVAEAAMDALVVVASMDCDGNPEGAYRLFKLYASALHEKVADAGEERAETARLLACDAYWPSDDEATTNAYQSILEAIQEER